jgi:hypothetical protein
LAIYVTSAWGFAPESWASLGFSEKKYRDDLANALTEGDQVLIVGTDGEETYPLEQGRLLGLVTVARRPVQTIDLISREQRLSHQSRLERGKWKFGLPYLAAERFTADPLPATRQVLPRIYAQKLNRKIATGYERLSDNEAQAVLEQTRSPVEKIFSSNAIVESRRQTEWIDALRRLSKGPPPTFQERTQRLADGPAHTYIFEFHGDLGSLINKKSFEIGDRKLWKIGWSIDPVRRLKVINAYFPNPEHCGWKSFRSKLFPTIVDAYAIEQRVLSTLRAFAHKNEMVFCPEKQVVGVLETCSAMPPTLEEEVAFGMSIDDLPIA